MKQLCLELWIENKQFPVFLILKIIIVLTALFSDILIKGWNCGFIAVFLVLGLIFVTAFLNPQIEYLLPRTDEEQRKSILWKAVMISGFYTAAGTAGYALTVFLGGQYRWDAELLFFLIVFGIDTFANIFCCYLGVWQRKNRAAADEPLRQNVMHMDFFEWLKAAAVFFSDIGILFFCFYRFGRQEAFLFPGRDKWQTAMFILMGIAAALLCIGAWRDAKKISIKDYCE